MSGWGEDLADDGDRAGAQRGTERAEVGQDLVEHLVAGDEPQAADGLERGMPLVAWVDAGDPVDRVGEGPGHAGRLGVP